MYPPLLYIRLDSSPESQSRLSTILKNSSYSSGVGPDSLRYNKRSILGLQPQCKLKELLVLIRSGTRLPSLQSKEYIRLQPRKLKRTPRTIPQESA